MGQEEEELQAKPLQRMDEEDELQMTPLAKSIQRIGEEEDELQMKPLQLEAMEEDEKLQMMPLMQRVGDEGGEVSTDFESELNAARGSGQSLAPDLQARIGQAMGADFSGVRVHTDGRADGLNRSVGARAFTTGQDLFFKRGEYQPGSRGGQELIAHELTHVVQQNLSSKRADTLRQKQPLQSKPINFKILQRNGDEEDIEVLSYEAGELNRGPYFEHIKFSDGSYWSTKIAKTNSRFIYLDIREGLHKGAGFSVRDADGYKASEVKVWLLGYYPKLRPYWKAYREAATQ